MNLVTLIFYGSDGAAAKELAVKIRAETKAAALVRDVAAFHGASDDPHSRVVVMPCVTERDVKRLTDVYGESVTMAGASLPPPPPPPPFDPLANLAPDWRKRDDLRQIAASVSGGRSVENKAQAIAVIEAALKARA